MCFAVFDPLQLEVLRNYAGGQTFETIIVSLDTVADLATQLSRVGGDAERKMSAADFDRARNELARTDLLVRGDADTIFAAVAAAVRLLVGRGGTLTRGVLEPLVDAGVLLQGAEKAALRHASYDLRLGRQVWTNRALVTLTDQSPTVEIAPYSYAIVTAEEGANLPTFVTAQFDIKVSLFLRGVVLSNGPQIDPGYRGQLFCMLFNGSSAPLTLSAGSHFATLEFSTTTEATEPYDQQYQLQQKLGQIMNEGAMSGPGGNIIGDFDNKIEAIADRVSRIQGPLWGVLAILVAIALVPIGLNYAQIVEAQRRLDEQLHTLVEEFEARLSSVESIPRLPEETTSSAPSESSELLRPIGAPSVEPAGSLEAEPSTEILSDEAPSEVPITSPPFESAPPSSSP